MSNWAARLHGISVPSLETVLTHPQYFSLTTATETQRLVCRLIEFGTKGVGESSPVDTEVFRAVPSNPPLETFFAAGIRGGKSLFQAACIVHSCLSVPLTTLRPGEVPRASIVSVDKRSAQVTLDHIVGSCKASPVLSRMLKQGPNESWFIERPDGRTVEICVIANRREGAGLVSTWSAGVCFDECARMSSDPDAVINLEDARAAVLGRILPGARIVYTSSPTAPYGLFYERVTKPEPQDLVVQARGDLLNPVFWTPERIAALRERDPDVYLTDYLAQFSSPEAGLFPLASVTASTQSYVSLPPEPGLHYVAAIDPATRGNAFTLVIATRKGNKRIVARAVEWRGSKVKPLSLRDTLREVAIECGVYGITNVLTDQYMSDALFEFGREFGLNIFKEPYDAKQRSINYLAVSQKMSAGCIQIPDDPTLRSDLLRAIKVPMASGGVTIKLPTTADGRHCDYVPSFIAALAGFCRDEDEPVLEETYAQKVGRMLKEEAFKKVREEQRRIQNPWKRFR